MSNSAWCDLNNKGDVLGLHDMCPNIKCICLKQGTFTSNQLQGSQKAWDSFLRSEVNTVIGIVV